ncbi:protein TolQ [Aromatoleum aromaticum]|uniref:Tol-Pal system protein TolQ n=1 Tax=Aromatoleum aromaticum (strain DSM 19018 / LMG 30748 / EbN1) TaxID=76114 RepID=Q5P4Z9_AROAE|nr:protein TolQ [Aromatoleum aromaticum]NMG54822.1 protein TolQ [Aromatoleum aromaticum]CAI07613.1 TOLQ-related transport transmembrane protein [Aromatoleum aromaticum EbN1]
MTLTENLSIISLVSQASVLVQLVMTLLATLSLVSWYWIFRKSFQIRSARNKTNGFERDFWSGGDLNGLFQSAAAARHQTGGMERIFESGYREFTKLRAKSHDHAATIDGARRAMRATYQREMDDLEAHLAFLASVGSVSPYIGLLGTVWGIMNAFRGLSNVSSATLAQVAPGIAEALVATAIGLFAAIPAVVAYNRFAHDIDRVGIRFESFMEEFSNILQRQLR